MADKTSQNRFTKSTSAQTAGSRGSARGRPGRQDTRRRRGFTAKSPSSAIGDWAGIPAPRAPHRSASPSAHLGRGTVKSRTDSFRTKQYSVSTALLEKNHPGTCENGKENFLQDSCKRGRVYAVGERTGCTLNPAETAKGQRWREGSVEEKCQEETSRAGGFLAKGRQRAQPSARGSWGLIRYWGLGRT